MQYPSIHRAKFTLVFLAISLLGSTYVGAVCNQPPVPTPGQTVTWAKADSPFQICTELTIPKGGRVIVEPGVQLQFQGHTLTVSGVLNAQGQATSHTSISAQDVFPPAITVQNGSLNIT
jgi:hypothetical protein